MGMIDLNIGENKRILTNLTDYKDRTHFSVYDDNDKTLISEYVLNLKVNENFTCEFILDAYHKTSSNSSKIFKVTEDIIFEVIEYIMKQETGSVVSDINQQSEEIM